MYEPCHCYIIFYRKIKTMLVKFQKDPLHETFLILQHSRRRIYTPFFLLMLIFCHTLYYSDIWEVQSVCTGATCSYQAQGYQSWRPPRHLLRKYQTLIMSTWHSKSMSSTLKRQSSHCYILHKNSTSTVRHILSASS